MPGCYGTGSGSRRELRLLELAMIQATFPPRIEQSTTVTEESGRQEEQRADECEQPVQNCPDDSERNRKQPENGPANKYQKSEWPAQHEYDREEQQGEQRFHG